MITRVITVKKYRARSFWLWLSMCVIFQLCTFFSFLIAWVVKNIYLFTADSLKHFMCDLNIVLVYQYIMFSDNEKSKQCGSDWRSTDSKKKKWLPSIPSLSMTALVLTSQLISGISHRRRHIMDVRVADRHAVTIRTSLFCVSLFRRTFLELLNPRHQLIQVVVKFRSVVAARPFDTAV